MSDVSFLDQVLTGDRLITEIDDFVDAWHNGESPAELRDFLGMTAEEYALWLRDPGMLTLICTARSRHQSLADAVNDNLPQIRMAARSFGGARLKSLEAWLRSQGKIG